MDNHPIPQDVTNFQFRLIGDMTLKQFGFVAAGVILAWVMLASPLFLLLKLALAGGCVLTGVIFAFVPIEGRSADVMVLHFIKALFSPTQFIYQKAVRAQSVSSQPMLTQTPQAPKQEVEKKDTSAQEKKVQVESLPSVAIAAAKVHDEQPASAPIVMPTAPVQTPDKKQEQNMQDEAKHLADELTQAKAAEAKTQQGTVIAKEAHEKVTDLEKELQEVLQQKQELERQLVALQKSLSDKKQAVFSPGTAEIPEETQHVKRVPKQMSAGVGTPLVPDVPNLITGVIKDPRGNVLGNMLIEVKDKDGNPVRAFKTNQLGQFAAATPLVSGTYTITFEDPAGKQTFDSVEIVANGEILLPLEIISVDAREKLRQELFGSTT